MLLGCTFVITFCPQQASIVFFCFVLQLLYIDTEGFESTGRSNSYDDRVFAVATVLSSLLIYNLPETIRGSDVSKLSFVVELATGFYETTRKVSGAMQRMQTQHEAAGGKLTVAAMHLFMCPCFLASRADDLLFNICKSLHN